MKRKWIAALLAGCMLAALLLTGCSAAETVKRLRFGVAGEGGVYHNFGEQFAALENETSNGTIELRTTAGSAANLRLLTGEYLQLAIAQADLAQDACNQTGIFAEEEDIRGFGAHLSQSALRKANFLIFSCGPTRTSSPSRTCRAKP